MANCHPLCCKTPLILFRVASYFLFLPRHRLSHRSGRLVPGWARYGRKAANDGCLPGSREGGAVPEIWGTNFSKEAVLVVDGTESPRSRSRRSRSPALSRGDGTIGGGTSSPARTTPVKGQTGAAFLVGDTFAGIDLFDRPATLKNLFPKLLSAVAMEAMMSGPGGKGGAKTDGPPGGE